MKITELGKRCFILKDLECVSFKYYLKKDITYEACIVNANISYKPGVYIVYDFSNNKLGDLLYVGKAGADKEGNINTHQLPKRLLATINPIDRYRKNTKMPKSKDVTRNIAWPIMMEIDKISAIKIFCFYSVIENSLVTPETNPIVIENLIKSNLKTKPKWSLR